MQFVYNILITFILNGVALFGLIKFLPEIQYTGGIKFFIVGGLVLGVINTFIKPLIKLISLPFIILSAGLFLIVINGGVMWFLSYFLSVAKFQDVSVTFPSVGTYVVAAVVFGLINWILSLIFK